MTETKNKTNAQNELERAINLIKLEYSIEERDDIVVELYNSDRRNYLDFFMSFHKRDLQRRYAKYWVWQSLENKLNKQM